LNSWGRGLNSWGRLRCAGPV